MSSNQNANLVPPPYFPWKWTTSRLGPGGWPARTLPLQNLPREQRDGYKPPPISRPQIEYLGPLKQNILTRRQKGVANLQPSTPGTSTIKKKDTTGTAQQEHETRHIAKQHTGLSALGSKTSNRQWANFCKLKYQASLWVCLLNISTKRQLALNARHAGFQLPVS